MPGETLGRFKRWFWRPPRPHGETIADRTVSFLELHGREDGRTRSTVFVQMGILALLAVFTAEATPNSSRSRGPMRPAWACRRRRSSRAPSSPPTHDSSCGPASPSPGSWASSWWAGRPASA